MEHVVGDISQYIYTYHSVLEFLLFTSQGPKSGPFGVNGKDDYVPGAPTNLKERGRCDLGMLCDM